MKKFTKFILCVLCINAQILIGQTTSDFETIPFGGAVYLNDAGANGIFSDGNIALPNTYDAQFDACSLGHSLK